jgi:hypothetical protein
MEVTKDRLELAHDLAFERDVHPKNAVGGWMLRAHRDFHQLAVKARSHRARRPLLEFLESSRHVKYPQTQPRMNTNLHEFGGSLIPENLLLY